MGFLPLVVELGIFQLLGLNKEILNSPHFLISLIAPETQRRLYFPNLTPTLLGAKQPRTKWCRSSQPWGNDNILFSNDSIAPTNKIKVYVPIDSEHKLHQKGLHICFPVGIELELPVYCCAVLTSTSCWPGNCLTLNFYNIIGILLE